MWTEQLIQPSAVLWCFGMKREIDGIDPDVVILF